MGILRLTSLQSRIFVFFLVLFIAIQGLTLGITYHTTLKQAQSSINAQLQVGQRVLSNEFESLSLYLLTSVDTIARDWAFRAAVGQDDRSTLDSVVSNHSRRIGADMGMVFNIDGDITANTLQGKVDTLALQQLLTTEQPGQPFVFYLQRGQDYYFTVVAPVKAPVTLGWVCMGYALNEGWVERLEQLTGLQISLLTAYADQLNVFASSLPLDVHPILNTLELDVMRDTLPITVEVITEPYLSLPSALPRSDNSLPLYALLQQPLAQALQPFRNLWGQLTLVFVLGLLLSLLGAYLIARGITRPVRWLLEAARRISQGDYQAKLPAMGNSEVAELAQGFAQMQAAVADRERAIRYQAFHDPLTQLYNRSGFIEQLNKYIELAEPFAVITLDVTRFREINDTLGHKSGDRLLIAVSQRLQQRLPHKDILVRLGGDEFGIIISAANQRLIGGRLQMLQSIFDAPFQHDGFSLHLSCACGVAIYPEHDDTPVGLLRLSDIAMYQSKAKHQHAIIYTADADQHSVQRLSLMSELRQAIQEGQLVLYYQPQLSLPSQQVQQVECLVRWIHPVHGFIAPDDFISLAEQTGQIHYLTQWVLDTALAQVSVWRQQNWDIRVSVNLSALDLLHPQLIKHIETSLYMHQVSPQHVILEVTESALVEEPDKAILALQQLRDLGITLSVDDYGTGYSSLGQIKTLPVDELKIDKSFVIDFANNAADRAIVYSSIKLGHELGLKVVAEGVEDDTSLQQLMDAQCDLVQGYYISKPLPHTQLSDWFEQGHYPTQQVRPHSSQRQAEV